ncbi:MAG: peptidylprolyl isomerase [Ferruginibacter sp.]
MKNLFTLAASFLIACTAFSQPLFTYGNSSTGKEEFLRAYNKNKPVTTDKEKSIKEYLTLYTNFKLKVKAAKELRLDTLAQIKYDVQNFRDQIADNYLNDEQLLDVLVKEAAERAAQNVHVLYFPVPVAENATPADTLKAFNASKELFLQLKKGTNNYAEIVNDVSAKFSTTTYSDAGYITAFMLPYDLENIIYNTGVGNVCEPFKSKKGYTVFKVADVRADVGKWKVAQILFAYPPDADYSGKLAIKSKADSVYVLLQKGLSFDEAAKTYSNDRMSYSGGGELPEFTTGKYNVKFEDNVFGLKTDSSFTKPFETDFGYHIVKRLSKVALFKTPGDANYLYDIKQKVQQDARINTVKEKFVKAIIPKIGFKKMPGFAEAALLKAADSIIKNPAIDFAKLGEVNNKILLGFKNGKTVKGQEWLQYVKDNNYQADVKNTDGKLLLRNFTSQMILNYYKNNLEEYNSDFKYQMQEFEEGNMLFEIMERNVWSKAGLDSVGLLNYYNVNKSTYKWQESADVLIFNCADENTATAAITSLKAGQPWSAVVQTSNDKIQADSGRYELLQLPTAINNSRPKLGDFSKIAVNGDGTTVFVNFIKLYAGNLQRTFGEARGLVINDYQNILEQQWVSTLRKKYEVKINAQTLNAILK